MVVPRRITTSDRGLVVETAKTRPERLGRPLTHWSIRKLADYLATKKGRKVRIGRERLRQILTAEGITFQRTKTWKEYVELCFTPTDASWANPIESHFGPLRQFVLAASDHADHAALAEAIRSYLRWRNANTRAPNLLEAERRQRARVRSEQQRRWGHPNGRPHEARERSWSEH